MLVSAALLAGCGGGASSATPPVQNGSGTSPMTLTLTLPGRSTSAKNGKRVPLYTSIDTKGIGVEYKAHGSAYSGAPSTQPTFGAAIGAGASGNAVCTAAGSNGAYSCTLYIPSVPVGYDDFRVTLWNAAPAGCTSSGSTCNFLNTGDKALSYAVVSNQAILAGVPNHAGINGATPPPNSTNNLSFTLNPVVDNVSVTLNGAIVNGQASNSTVTVSAKDAAGDVILGSDPFVDANGNALTISLSLVNNCGTSLSFTAPSASPSFTSGGAGNTATVHYDGSSNCPTSGSLPQVHVTASQALNGSTQDATFGVTASSGSISLGAVPQASKEQALSSTPVSIAAATDSNFYVAETNAPYMEQFNPSGFGRTGVAVVSNSISSVAMGQDGWLWYLDDQHASVVKQPLGTATSGSAVSGFAASANMQSLAAAPDGNLWFVDATGYNLDSIAPASMSTSTINTGSIFPAGPAQPAAAGTFGNGDVVACGGTWDNGGSSYMMCANQTAGTSFPISLGAGIAYANGMAFGPDHTLYVTTSNGKIETFTSGFAAGTTYTVPSGIGGAIVAGPDGNMWFTISASGLGRIVLSGSAAQTITGWTDYTQIFHTIGAPSNTPDFVQLAVGSDNRLWALDAANNQVVRIDP